MKRPNWTYNQLNAAIRRRDDLMSESECEADCICNPCIEYFALDYQIDCFTESEKAGAVIAVNEGRGDELVKN